MASTTKKNVAKGTGNACEDLRGLLVMKVRVLYGLESELQKALGSWVKKASDVDLKGILEESNEGAPNRIKRLTEVCETLGVKAQKMPCGAMQGLIADMGWIGKNIKNISAQDAALLAGMSAIECYKAAGYATAVSWAKLLEKDEVADLLEQNLDDENEIDEKLGDLAELKIDEKALPEDFSNDDSGDDDDEEEDDDQEDDDGEE